MEPVVINGHGYFPVSYVSELWGLKEKTIKGYALPKSGKIPGCLRHNGVFYVPADAVRPITRPVAQGLIWSILHIQNDPAAFLDLSTFGIRNDQLQTVLHDLKRQQYIDYQESLTDVRERLLSSRITRKGFSLVEYKERIKENPIKKMLNPENIGLAFAAVQTVLQITQLAR